MLDAKDAQVRSDELWNNTAFSSLREQQEADFGLWGPKEYTMPKEEGKWDDVTTNSPKVLGTRIISLLSAAWSQLSINTDDATRTQRGTISQTEQFANGIIYLADRELTKLPSKRRIQDSLASYASLKGGTVKSFMYSEDKNGNPIPRVGLYDPTFSQWIEGPDGLTWFCYRDYLNQHYVTDKFGQFLPDGYGKLDRHELVKAYTFIDDNEWMITINGEKVDGGEHRLGYVPVNVRPTGAVPYIASETYQDTMKYSWVSIFSNNREIYDLESKLLSIEASKAIESGKIKIAGEWDSDKSNNELPEGLEKLGYSSDGHSTGRNEIVMFDAAKGQRFGGMVEPPTNEIVDRLLSRIQGMITGGSVDPIALGTMTRSGSGALAAELRASALEFITPFRRCVQDDIVWFAEESVRQFKNGDFKSINLVGTDTKHNKFSRKFKRSDIEENYFEDELVIDKLRDELQELGAAIQKISYGLSSKKTVMVKHNIVDDPDREMDKMAEELAEQDPVFKYSNLSKYFYSLGTPEGDEMGLLYDGIAKMAIQSVVEQAASAYLTPPEEPPVQPTISPQMNTANIATQPQRDLGGLGV